MNESNEEIPGDKSMITSKAMQLCNNYPFMAWLRDLFVLEMTQKLRNNRLSNFDLNDFTESKAYLHPNALIRIQTTL